MAGAQHVPDDRIALGTCGPDGHGVSRLARRIASAAGDLGFTGTVLDEPDPARLADLADRLPVPVRLLHLHVSDWLIVDAGAEPDRVLAALVQALTTRGVRLALTLHDVPQVSDGPEQARRRARTYGALAAASVGVAVCSAHERSLLREVVGMPEDTVAVVPLPIDPFPGGPPPHSATPAGPPTVAVLGYLYPGKGHRELLDELAGTDPPVGVLAIGRPSERHHDLPAALSAVAGRHGISFRTTGYVPEDQLLEQLRAPVIPVAPQTKISASASINTWIGAGRRPLVQRGRYAEELAGRLPGAVRIYRPGRLRAEVELAHADPALTWLPDRLRVGPTTRDVTRTHLAWLRGKVLAT